MQTLKRWSLVTAVLALATTGCGTNADPTSPSASTTAAAAPQATAVAAAASQEGEPTQSDAPSQAPETQTSETQTSDDQAQQGQQAASDSASPSGSAQAPGKTLGLAPGETAKMKHFDVTMLKSQFGQDSVSHGWKVRVCYTRAHPDANPDGTTRVSADPWSVLVRDGEGSKETSWYPLDDFPADKGWTPPYQERQLAVGDCTEGWLAIRHDNPDLQFSGLRYQPADFDEVATWIS
ncbi:hypothetical protein [Luteococcus sp. OSA5]|uniref:hypothetical protein n=1 Tax=Luteococcus sp. OSA5 TaxID=3401630 RepID=UPI003B439D63